MKYISIGVCGVLALGAVLMPIDSKSVTVKTKGDGVALDSVKEVGSVLATFAACGASGIAGGSLLLIPSACSLFGIPNDIAIQVVGVGFIISVLQDSLETALNSSSDVVFTATADYYQRRKSQI